MSSKWIRIGLVLGAAACGKRPPEAPEELADLGLFLFGHFEDQDPAELSAGVVNLRELILASDLTLDPEDRAVTMPILQGEDLGGLSIPDGADPALQVPIALAGESVHPLDDQVVTVVEPNQVCIESASTVWARREFMTDAGCFEGGSCDRLEISQEVRKENFLAKVWLDQSKSYRWITLEDEEGEVGRALLGRSWIERTFLADGGNNSWDQLFHLDLFIEDPERPERTLRWFSMWSSVTIGGLGDELYAKQVVLGIAEALQFGDEFIAGDIQSCKIDRNAEKPPRE